MKSKAWTVTFCAVAAGIAIAIAQNKTLPCIDALQAEFAISKAAAGWLSSVFCVMGVAMAFPAAVIVERLGVQKTCVLSLLCAAGGTLLGLLSRSVSLMLLSRVIEGVGAGLISIAVPALIAMWFPPEKRGLPTGLWTSWQFVGQAVCFFLGAAAVAAWGWRSVWAGSLALLLLCTALSRLFICAPAQPAVDASAESGASLSLGDLCKNKPAWLLSLSMFCFCFACFGFITWAASCWMETLQMRASQANSYIGIFTLVSLPVVLAAGWVLDHVNRKRFGTIMFFLYAGIVAVAFLLPQAKWALAFVLIYPFFEGAVSTSLWTMIPQTAKTAGQVPMVIALFTLMSNAGMLLGPPAVGMVIERFGWPAAAIVVAAMAFIGTAALLLVKTD